MKKFLLTPWPWLGGVLAFLIFLPNLVWQYHHDWATLEFVRAINLDGRPRWEAQVGASIDGSAAVGDDGTVYIGNDAGYLIALTPGGGVRWRYETGADIRATPARAQKWSSTACKALTLIGFGRCSSIPAARHSSRSTAMALAVMAMMGVCWPAGSF